MRPLDIILHLALAARIHGTDAAVVATAKRLLKAVPRRDRQSLFDVINQKAPCRYIINHVESLPNEVIFMDLKAERVPPHTQLAQAKASAGLSTLQDQPGT